jgi:hypothetical protein
MKTLLSLATFLAVCSLAEPANSLAAEQPQSLYVHFFAPAFINAKNTLPPRLIISAKIHLADDFDIRLGTYQDSLSGLIEARDGKFHAHLRVTFGTSTGDYDGNLELEKEVMPTNYMFSGAICLTYFVLSTNADCQPFLASHEATVKSHGSDVPSQLLERKGDKIVNAPPEDLALARTYHTFKDKGALISGQRVTIMTAKTNYKVGEPIRILHVLESVREGIKVYVMGPKTIYDEYVDGGLVTPKGPGNDGYDGMVIDRLWADFNYDITTYTFSEPGEHTIQWKGGGHPMQGSLGLESNIIKLEIVKE